MLNVGIIGVGLVGSELISQLGAFLAKPGVNSPKFNVVALASSKLQLLSNSAYDPLSLSTWKETLQSKGTAVNLTAFGTYLSGGRNPTVVVDNTASQQVAEQYPFFLKQGLHIVTPNKKAFSGDLILYQEILAESQTAGKLVYHESTVGAGLPVLSTLNDLIKTGDSIVKIEGIFSGTLSYLFNTFSAAEGGDSAGEQKFSDIVKVAKENGFTEPDPRDDLNGLDVARKVVILGRIAGQNLALETLPVENIVPEALRSVSTSQEFLARLPEFDQHFAQLNQTARNGNKVLRYVGVIDPINGQSSVSLISLPVTHPFTSLKGSDNIIAFTTKRFPNPLIIQGAGAGAAVTAFGIFSDLFKVAERTGIK